MTRDDRQRLCCFYPEQTKFWTFKASNIETQAQMCTQCGAIIWFGDKTKLTALKKDPSVASPEGLQPPATAS